jgi:crossover junction endodeoxyribonuclease RusA
MTTVTQVGDVILLPRIDDAFLVAAVVDTPAPQGSKTIYRVGQPPVESSKKVAPWREAVKTGIREAPLRPDTIVTGPVRLRVTFTLRRPKGHYRTGKNAHLLRDSAPPYPAGKPDVDKLLRSTLDAIVAAGVIADDAQIVECEARKVYPQTHYDALDRAGAVIRMWRLP